MLKLALFVAGVVCSAFFPTLPSLWNLFGLWLLMTAGDWPHRGWPVSPVCWLPCCWG
jgi:hypothetical protein